MWRHKSGSTRPKSTQLGEISLFSQLQYKRSECHRKRREVESGGQTTTTTVGGWSSAALRKRETRLCLVSQLIELHETKRHDTRDWVRSVALRCIAVRYQAMRRIHACDAAGQAYPGGGGGCWFRMWFAFIHSNLCLDEAAFYIHFFFFFCTGWLS